jgi:uncharacterized protein (DUF2147 family)
MRKGVAVEIADGQVNRLARSMALVIAALAGALLLGGGAGAQDASPAGLWKTIDDETGQAKALVRISEDGGVLRGRIEKLFNPSRPNPTCDQCSDARKGQPIEGMTILDGLKRDGDNWEGGEILDPNQGKVYRAKAKLVDGGSRLEVRGFVGVSLFGRTQTWIREK